MKTIFSLGQISIHMIYPLIIIFVNSGINKAKVFLISPIQTEYFFITSIGVMFLAEMIAGCLYFISQCMKSPTQKIILKNNKTVKMKQKKKIKVIQSKYYTKYTKTVISFILVLGCIDFISSVINYLRQSKFSPKEIADLMLFVQFFIYTLLSVVILKQEINRHHYVGICINTIGAFIALIPLFMNNFKLTSILVNLGRQFLNGVLFTFEKWLMEYKRVNPFFLLLIQGVLGFAIFAILLTFQFTLCPIKEVPWYCNDVTFYSKLTTIGIWFVVIELVRFIIVNICIIQTIRYYSPLNLLGTFAISMFFDWIVEMCLGKKFNLFDFIGFLLITIGYSIFNEIILLHFCNLDYDTKKMINIRGKENEIEEDIDMKMEDVMIINNEQENEVDCQKCIEVI